MYTWLKFCWEIGFIRERAATLLKKNKRLERHVVPRVTQNESSLSVKPQRIRVVIVYWVACVTQACNALRVSVRIQYGRLNRVLFLESIIHLDRGLVWCSDITIGDNMHSHRTKKTPKCLRALPYLHNYFWLLKREWRDWRDRVCTLLSFSSSMTFSTTWGSAVTFEYFQNSPCFRVFFYFG